MRGGWVGSGVWDKVLKKNVFFIDTFPYVILKSVNLFTKIVWHINFSLSVQGKFYYKIWWKPFIICFYCAINLVKLALLGVNMNHHLLNSVAWISNEKRINMNITRVKQLRWAKYIVFVCVALYFPWSLSSFLFSFVCFCFHLVIYMILSSYIWTIQCGVYVFRFK